METMTSSRAVRPDVRAQRGGYRADHRHPLAGTTSRWRREGMLAHADWRNISAWTRWRISVDISPAIPLHGGGGQRARYQIVTSHGA